MKIKLMLLLLVFSSQLFAGSGADIAKKAHLASYYFGNDGSAQLLMKVYASEKAKPISKLFYMLRLDVEEGGRQMFFTYFEKPSDIKRTTFLVHKEIEKDDFRRLYIPASDKVIPIAGNRKQDPFMGSDFTYEDVSGRHFSKDNHKLLKDDSVDGKKTFVVESTPKVKEDKISKIKYWIDKSNYIPLKVEFYDHSGKVYRVYSSKLVKSIQGFPTILKREMVSVQSGTKTIILVNPKKVKYDVGLTQKDFSERSLKNPPTKYFK